MNNLGSST